MSKLPIEKTVHGQNDSPLFLLPSELRNQIYQLVLCQKKSKKKTMTEKPANSPYEVIHLQDAPDLQPTNELLGTCRRIYDEARRLFVVAQRNFWASNNFLIELRDDWRETSNTTLEPRTDITQWRHEYFNLMPRIVISARYKIGSIENHLEHRQEHHLVHSPNGGYQLELDLRGNDGSLNGSLNAIVSALEHTTIWLILREAYEEGIPSQLNSRAVQASKYGKLAQKYVQIAVSHREDDLRKQKHMVEGLQKSIGRLLAERARRWDLLRRVTLNAVLKHLSEHHGVQLRPQPGAD